MRNVETKLRSFVGEDEEVRHDGYLRTALCVERWLERRRKWRHINIVTAVATGRGWQAKRPQCFFSIPLILFARRSFLSLEKGPPFRPSTPVTRENSELETAIPANHRSLALRFYFSTHEDQLRVIKYSFQSKIAPSILSSLFITIPNLDTEISHLFMLIPFFFSISPIPIVGNIPARTSWRITRSQEATVRQRAHRRFRLHLYVGRQLCVHEPRTRCHICVRPRCALRGPKENACPP